MLPTPEISVVLPVYNAGGYLSLAIESVLNQTFNDFELIVIDDGSTDSSASVIQSYADGDSRVVFLSRENRGLVATLNEGIELAKAPLIARMDADDISLPNRFERQKQFLDENPQVVCVGATVRVIDAKGRYLIDNRPPLTHDEAVKSALQGVSPVIHPSAMIRTEALIEVGCYREENYPAEDLALWIDLSEVGKLINLEEVLLEYRVHDNSISTSRHELQIERTYEICKQACEKRGVPVEMKTVVGRPGKSRAFRAKLVVKHGWWAFSSKQWSTSATYSFRAISYNPLNKEAWRLLFCSFFRRS